MKLIEKKVVKAVPELIWGNKYVTTGGARSQEVTVGTEVLLTNSNIDSDGEVPICTEARETWIKPENLKPVTEGEEDGDYVAVVLQDNNSGKDYLVKPEQLTPVQEDIPATYTVELTEAEVAVINRVFGRTSPVERREFFESETVNFDAGKVGTGIYEGFKQLLEGGK